MTEPTTVTTDDLARFIARARQALCEAGRPGLADRAHAVVLPDGTVRLSFNTANLADPGCSDPDVIKFLAIDPVFGLDTEPPAR